MAPKSILMVIMIKYSSLGVSFLLSGFPPFPAVHTHGLCKSNVPEMHKAKEIKFVAVPSTSYCLLSA